MFDHTVTPSTDPAGAPPATLDPASGPAAVTAAQQPDPPPAAASLEVLEAEICELAGHLAAATCRFLVLLAEFDGRRGFDSRPPGQEPGLRACHAPGGW